MARTFFVNGQREAQKKRECQLGIPQTLEIAAASITDDRRNAFFLHQAPIGTINVWFWIFGISGFSGRRATVAGKGGVPGFLFCAEAITQIAEKN